MVGVWGGSSERRTADLFLRPHVEERGRGLSLGSLYKATDPIQEAPPSRPNHPSKALPSNHHVGGRCQHTDLGATKLQFTTEGEGCPLPSREAQGRFLDLRRD